MSFFNSNVVLKNIIVSNLERLPIITFEDVRREVEKCFAPDSDLINIEMMVRWVEEVVTINIPAGESVL